MNARKFLRSRAGAPHAAKGQKHLSGSYIYLGLVMEAGLLTCGVPYDDIARTCSSLSRYTKEELHESIIGFLSTIEKLDTDEDLAECSKVFPAICELARRSMHIGIFLEPGVTAPLFSHCVFKLEGEGYGSRLLGVNSIPQAVCGNHEEMAIFVKRSLRTILPMFEDLSDYSPSSAVHAYF